MVTSKQIGTLQRSNWKSTMEKPFGNKWNNAKVDPHCTPHHTTHKDHHERMMEAKMLLTSMPGGIKFISHKELITVNELHKH